MNMKVGECIYAIIIVVPIIDTLYDNNVIWYIGELTEEKQRQLTGMAYKFLGGDGNLPNIQQIITTARESH